MDDIALSPRGSRATTTAVTPDEWHTYLFNRASWGAIVAGIAAALVVQLMLNMLGLGIGMASFSVTNTADNPDVGGFSMTAGIWWTVSGIIASFIGGAVAGRLCGAAKTSTARWHGLVAWSATTLLVAYLLASALGGVVGGTFNALGSTISGAGKAVASAVPGLSPGNAGGGLEAQVRGLVNPNDAQNVQNDVMTYIKASISGDQKAADAARDSAVNGLARTANISPEEARNRLNSLQQQATQAAQQAKDAATKAAEVARTNASRAGFFGFVVLILGAVAAWFGGGAGTPRQELVTTARIAT